MTRLAVDRGGDGAPAEIPNFAWVEARLLARGQQPPLTLSAYRELQEFGFSTVLSLRAAREYQDGGWRSYDAADERALCQTLGLTFQHVACTDFQAPHPGEVVRALSILYDEVEHGRAVYVHCLAGVGRTGVVCGAWQMLRGAGGTEALRQYAYFCEESRSRRVAHRPPAEYLHAIGAHYQVWALLMIARALDLPADPLPDFVRPQRPANGKHWRRRFHDQLQRHVPAMLNGKRADAV